MPITPFHLGPGILQKAAAPATTDLRLYAATALAIDAEPIAKGLAGLAGFDFGSLHTWTHTPLGLASIALSCAVAWIWFGLSTRWAAVSTVAGAAGTHWLLDSLMHGGGDMPPLLPGNLQALYGVDYAHSIAVWCFLIGGGLLLWNNRKVVGAWVKRELA